MRIAALLCVNLVLLAGCAHYPQEDGEKLANEVYALSTQVKALQKSIREQHQVNDQQADELEAFREEIKAFQRALRRNDADLGVQVDNLMQEMAKLKGLLEGTRERTEAIEQEIAHLTEEAKIASARSEEEKLKAIEAAKSRERLFSNPQSLFAEVRKRLKTKATDEARSLLQEFMRRSRTNKALAASRADAQYWMGESFFADKDYNRAARTYAEIHKKYAKSRRAPDAYLKIGMCFERLKMFDDAKLFYRTTRKKFPKSKAAKSAKSRLKGLRNK